MHGEFLILRAGLDDIERPFFGPLLADSIGGARRRGIGTSGALSGSVDRSAGGGIMRHKSAIMVDHVKQAPIQ